MDRTESVNETVRQYLLGELSEPEQATIETEYFANKERFEEISALENDLIDDYVRGSLSAHERKQFERHYLSSPEKLRRVQFAASMLSSLYSVPAGAGTKDWLPESTPLGPRRRFAALFGGRRLTPSPLQASFALILIVAVVLLGLECLRLKRALTTSRQTLASQRQREQELEHQLAEQRDSSDQLAKDLDALRSQQAKEPNNPADNKLSPIVAAFTLRSGLIRGTNESQELLVPPGADVVQLRLDLVNLDFKKCSATLLTPEGSLLWKQADVRVRAYQNGRRLVIRVPRKVLPPGDYLLRVDGVNSSGESIEVSNYYFRIAEEPTH